MSVAAMAAILTVTGHMGFLMILLGRQRWPYLSAAGSLGNCVRLFWANQNVDLSR